LIPGIAAAKGDKDSGSTLIARLMAVLAESGSEEFSGDDNAITTYNVDGNGSVVVIDEVVFNINLNDVEFEHGCSSAGGLHSRVLGMMRGHGLPGDHGPHGPPPADHPPIDPDMFPFEHGEMLHQFHGKPDHGRHPHPEIIEMFRAIPPEVDPGFVAWIMEIGEMAWTDPAFREQLEELLQEFQLHR